MGRMKMTKGEDDDERDRHDDHERVETPAMQDFFSNLWLVWHVRFDW